MDPGRAFPFACPGAREGDDIDHVLVAPADAPDHGAGGEDEPFLRYRRWLSPYRLARAAGLSDAAWFDVVGELDEKLKAVDGRGFRPHPVRAHASTRRRARASPDPCGSRTKRGMSRARIRAAI